MKDRLVTILLLSVLLATAGTAYGQGGTTSTISGVVVDTGGGVVPGADVTAKHNGTGVTTATVSNSEGAFSFPGLGIGTYTLTVTLQGFKTFVVNDVVLTSGAPAAVKAVLEVGGLTEQIVVSSTSEILQTQSTTISST
ncbi:MAG TPA: carboxypeptidase-like regulatory domain-containing protein, partial [Vicinamibacterales bacterium]|nr:carboxypeptidase-like regulatory domain-containing protein [Vicinamibacterales bacterium]